MPKLIIVLLPVLLLVAGCAGSSVKGTENRLSKEDCLACERINLFYKLKDMVSTSVWNGLKDTSIRAPLLYFTDNATYITSSNDEVFHEYEHISINCESSITLQKLNQRLDSVPFHMENKMSFKDASSLFYYRPMMLCSDVETMHQFVPDFETTEEWLQLVMHEYFHSFQFSHKNTINYLADTIQIAADTLNSIYLNNESFQQAIEQENKLLLNAIKTESQDSVFRLIDEFQKLRSNRRLKYQATSGFNLTRAENFWETIEGTARYTEYYMALHFSDVPVDTIKRCDSRFNGFANYSDPKSLEESKAFKTRTEIMPAYYYVTGFNLCRLMDKIGIEYKNTLFDRPEKGLYNLLIDKIDRLKHESDH